MSVFQYLQLQPIDPQDDGTTSALDDYAQDETIDLSQDTDGETLAQSWEKLEKEMHTTASERQK